MIMVSDSSREGRETGVWLWGVMSASPVAMEFQVPAPASKEKMQSWIFMEKTTYREKNVG